MLLNTRVNRTVKTEVLQDAMKIKRKELSIFQSKLIKWHKSNGRNFLWRENNDPFEILVAELILKKTGAWKAEIAINKIIQKYQSVKGLSLADPGELEPLFKNLGLIKRSEQLIDICLEIVNKYDGKVPNNYNELIDIKGIGQYIANAILCFAYNKRVPIVDSSVSRIFQRYFNYKSEKKAYADRQLWSIAEECLPKRKYRIYNYALIDFGFLICKPVNQLCDKCILKTNCNFFMNKNTIR